TYLSSTQLDLPSGAGLLSFFIPTEKLKTVQATPFKYSVGSQKENALKSWYEYGLQQFTGYIDYETDINIKKNDSDIFIDLGKVKYMAEVLVNGKSVGARLWPPYIFELSKELKPGDNTIRVRVGNLMIGNMWIQEDMGKLRNWGGHGIADFDQYDAGLFGPVKFLITE
ncbi:MAG: glycosylhydrolase-like jelly roll fold domain-containing protein, partial [Proteiniphilum sp.]